MAKIEVIPQLKWENSHVWRPELLFICSVLVRRRAWTTSYDEGEVFSTNTERRCDLCGFLISRNRSLQRVDCTIAKHFKKIGWIIPWRCYPHRREKNFFRQTSKWWKLGELNVTSITAQIEMRNCIGCRCQSVGTKGAAGVASVRRVQGLLCARHRQFQLAPTDPLAGHGSACWPSWWCPWEDTFKKGQNATERGGGNKNSEKKQREHQGHRSRKRRRCSR